MLQIDLTEIILQRLKKQGWKQNGGYAIFGKVRVLDRSGVKVAVVKPIKIDPFKVIQDQIDKIFKTLTEIILKNGIKDVFLPGGGNIPIPESFKDFCKKNNINIHIVTLDNIEDYVSWGI